MPAHGHEKIRRKRRSAPALLSSAAFRQATSAANRLSRQTGRREFHEKLQSFHEGQTCQQQQCDAGEAKPPAEGEKYQPAAVMQQRCSSDGSSDFRRIGLCIFAGGFQLGAFFCICLMQAFRNLTFAFLSFSSTSSSEGLPLPCTIVFNVFEAGLCSCRRLRQICLSDMGISEIGVPLIYPKCYLILLKEPQKRYPHFRKPPYENTGAPKIDPETVGLGNPPYESPQIRHSLDLAKMAGVGVGTNRIVNPCFQKGGLE